MLCQDNMGYIEKLLSLWLQAAVLFFCQVHVCKIKKKKMLSKRCWSKKEGQTTFILSYCFPLFPQNIGVIQHLWRTFSTNNKYVAADITSLNLVCSCTWESPQQISCCIGTAADIQPIFFTLVTRSLSPQKGLIWFTCWRSRLKIEVINALCLCPLLRIWGKGPSLLCQSGVKLCRRYRHAGMKSPCGNEKPLYS